MDTATMEYKCREHIAFGYVAGVALNAFARLCGSSWGPPVKYFGPPHPSWCQSLWHSSPGATV